MEQIRENIESIRQNISEICKRTGRNEKDITVIAVTKTVELDKINYAINCGIDNIGENRVQEIISKYEHIPKGVKWHLIGHLQTNKVKYIVDKVDLIHSVDSIGLAQEINKRSQKAGVVKEILVQVNVAREESKFGIDLDSIESFLNEISSYSNIKVKGLMTIAPFYEDIELTRPIFRALKQKFDYFTCKKYGNMDFKYLSMGMTNDYSVAIEEGANLIRIGTGIFGKRNYNII